MIVLNFVKDSHFVLVLVKENHFVFDFEEDNHFELGFVVETGCNFEEVEPDFEVGKYFGYFVVDMT